MPGGFFFRDLPRKTAPLPPAPFRSWIPGWRQAARDHASDGFASHYQDTAVSPRSQAALAVPLPPPLPHFRRGGGTMSFLVNEQAR